MSKMQLESSVAIEFANILKTDLEKQGFPLVEPEKLKRVLHGVIPDYMLRHFDLLMEEGGSSRELTRQLGLAVTSSILADSIQYEGPLIYYITSDISTSVHRAFSNSFEGLSDKSIQITKTAMEKLTELKRVNPKARIATVTHDNKGIKYILKRIIIPNGERKYRVTSDSFGYFGKEGLIYKGLGYKLLLPSPTKKA
jgi:hypothetical protein